MTLADLLAALDDAVDAGDALGLDVSAGRAASATARERLAFPSATYVLALAGGTGVGKSSLLNALAARDVSRAGGKRPTTTAPVAWIPRASRDDLAPLLAWLGVRDVREQDGTPAIGDVAVLDLPDIDSIAPEHRARVDELLPRVDAVAWVADPEKYQDAVLHDAYIAAWAPRLARQIVIVNKRDRLAPADAERVRADLATGLRERGARDVTVALTSATGNDVAELRSWLQAAADAKRVIAERLSAEARAAVRSLADRAGVRDGAPPLVTEARRRQLKDDVLREALAVVGVAELERQAVRATRLAARPRGAGPLGPLTAAVYRWSGRAQAAADPAAFLRRWRERATLVRASEPMRSLVGELVAQVPPAIRSRVAAAADPAALATRLADAIDRAAAAQGDLVAPRSVVWPVIGLAQYVVTGALLFTALWLALAIFARVEIGTTPLPVVGPVPTPLLVLSLVLLAGFVLARMLGAHAGWLGRRWAGRIRSAIAAEIGSRLDALLAPLGAIDAARQRLASAADRTRDAGDR